jgi:hypothetical protein
VKITGFLSAISAIGILLLLPEVGDAREAYSSETTIVRRKTASGFWYMTGGFTFDDQQSMERQSARYNLKLLFAPPSGTSISPVLLMIGDNQGHRIDKIVLHGPRFYIQLPPGSYTILARIKNKLVLLRDVYLGDDRRAINFFYRD